MLLVGFSLGCGGDLKLVPVSGKITVNREPLTTGTLALKPDRDKETASSIVLASTAALRHPPANK